MGKGHYYHSRPMEIMLYNFQKTKMEGVHKRRKVDQEEEGGKCRLTLY